MVVLNGPGGERTVPATAFFTGPRATAAGPDELITEVRFRRTGPGSGSACAEESRRAWGWGRPGPARSSASDRIAEARVALLGLAPTAVRATAPVVVIGGTARTRADLRPDPDLLLIVWRGARCMIGSRVRVWAGIRPGPDAPGDHGAALP